MAHQKVGVADDENSVAVDDVDDDDIAVGEADVHAVGLVEVVMHRTEGTSFALDVGA